MGITGKELIERGWPEGRVIGLALKAANAGEAGPPEGPERERELETLEEVRREPGRWTENDRYGELARELARLQAPEPYRFREDAGFPVWGEHLIEPGAMEQMRNAMRLPISVAGALMPDAHLAYGLPVGGVLATEGAIIPYAIGVDIAPLRGDTMIPTLDGRSYPIRELYEEGEEFGIWSCRSDGRVVAARARAHQTQRDAPLIRVKLDNGEVVDCTPEHRFMLRDGSYLEADRLSPGTSLMPFYSGVDREGYLRICQNYSGAFLRAHRVVARSGLMGEIPNFKGQRTVIHHTHFDHLANGAYNHKVIAVEHLTEREDVYCLDVPVYHNFALEAGVFVHNCRMRLTVVDMDPASLEDGPTRDALKDTLLRNTNFGAGGSYKPGRRGMDHEVMESPLWEEVPFVKHKRLRELGEAQLGTSGSGNHFVEIGELFDLETRERKVAILSHSGSRGVGYKIADHFTKRAKELHPDLPDDYRELAWLEMDHDLGREYHAAMTLAGEFARANHEVIHAKILRAMGVEPLWVIDHHHNWAWTEEMEGRTVYVHRKGATPAKAGQMGVIPGTMGDPGYVVRGLGRPESLQSAAHGAGRVMSRNRAFKELSREEMQRYLSERGITLIGGGLDEAPMAYKRIDEVIGLQEDLVDVVARFTPRIVRMDAAGEPRRRKKKARVEGAE